MFLFRRAFSASARAHPSFIPQLRQPRPSPVRWFRSALAVAVTGFVAKLYYDQTTKRRTAQILAAENDAAQLHRRNNALLDVYGDRSSLEELERAVEFYEKK